MTEIHDAWGLSLGADVSRHLSLEMAGDNFEKRFEPPGHAELGEYSVWAFVAQARLRYPVSEGRLVPCALGGVGGAFTQFNDRKPDGFGMDIETDSGAFLGSIGVGLEYFVSANVSFGLEVKCLISSGQDAVVNGESSSLSTSAPLMMASVRVQAPKLGTATVPVPDDAAPPRAYFSPRVGAAHPVGGDLFTGVQAKPEPSAFGGGWDQLFGFGVGLNINRHVSAELVLEGFETVLHADGYGDIGEYAVFSIAPHVRLRWPFLNDRLAPFAIAGVGLGYGEFNDRKPDGEGLHIDGQELGVGASVGAGVEYSLTRNLAVNLDARCFFGRGQTLEIDDGPSRAGHLDAVLIALGLRLQFP